MAELKEYIVPEVFNDYVIHKTNELSALYQSGIVSHNAELDALASGGGKLINMPYWEDLKGESAVATYDGKVNSTRIQAGQDVAALLQRVAAWNSPDMQGVLSGSDPAKAIGDMVAAFWARDRQRTLVKILDGVFANADMKGNTYTCTSFTKENAAQEILSAIYTLGDAHAKLTGIVCNSADALNIDLQSLASNNAQYITNYTEASQTTGRQIITDDTVPAGTIYLFGEGAIGLGNGQMPTPSEVQRQPDLGIGVETLYTRQAYLLHPRGVAFQNKAVTGITPSNAELANKSNWARVYEPKDIRIVKMTVAPGA